MPRRLDHVVSSVAAHLMDATASTATEVSQQVLANLVEQFEADASFLSHNDHNIGASRLVAELPPRYQRPDPDPLEVVQFASADPVFAYCAHGKEPVLIQPDPADNAYRGPRTRRGLVSRPRPTEVDQRLLRPRRRRFLPPGIAERLQASIGRAQRNRPIRRGRVPRHSGSGDAN
jgi:hypothetical protein